MKPLDPRLLERAAPARRHLAVVVAAGLATAAVVIAQATLLAFLIVHAGRGLTALERPIMLLLGVVVLRGLLSYGSEVSALRAAASVRSSLRRDLAARVLASSPRPGSTVASGSVATLMTKGLDSLDNYFARYLPQLVLAAIVPVVVVVWIASSDPLSAIVVGVTLPLIPVFMILVGMHTKARTDRQWEQLSRLGGHFLDVVEGLPTLKVFGRSKAQVALIRKVSQDYRRTTMATLRVAFLSAFVLELVATLATALVAVEVGLRLLHGNLSYQSALFVLLLAPEAYLPLRAVGASFHASADGVAAVSDALRLLESDSADPTDRSARVDLRRDSIGAERVTLRYPGRTHDALAAATLRIEPGECIVIAGPSGAGKSTLLSLLLGFLEPTDGRVVIGGTPLAGIDLDHLRRQIAWVPQAPRIFSGTVADNIRLGDGTATDGEIRRAVRAAGLVETIAAMPSGLDTVVGDRGLSLSTGQRQRIALARALLRDAPMLLLDEPTAHLDAATAADVRAAVARTMPGRTVVVVTHDDRWHELADRIVTLRDGQLVGQPHPATDCSRVVAVA